jgi:hypothetical protein
VPRWRRDGLDLVGARFSISGRKSPDDDSERDLRGSSRFDRKNPAALCYGDFVRFVQQIER